MIDLIKYNFTHCHYCNKNIINHKYSYFTCEDGSLNKEDDWKHTHLDDSYISLLINEKYFISYYIKNKHIAIYNANTIEGDYLFTINNVEITNFNKETFLSIIENSIFQ